MSTIFSKIIDGQIPCYKVYENDEFLAFLDIFPIAKGHTLVIPKKETDYLFDVNNEEYSRMWMFAKKVAIAQKKAISCSRIGVSVIGLEVAHAHIHLLPIDSVSDMNFSKSKLKFTEKEFEAIAKSISDQF